MTEITELDNNINNTSDEECALIEITKDILLDTRNTKIDSNNSLSVPIAKLSTLGAGISSLIPTLNTITQTTSVATSGLYRLANAGVGDTLKVAKNGNFWGALKKADGGSKMLQLKEAGSLNATSKAVPNFNPAVMMMSVALFSIEQELGKIEDMQKQIISFLEIEKESEIEADIESLMGIVEKYKDNWDNEHFVRGNHSQVLTYQNRARKNMLSYQKKVTEMIEKKQLIVAQKNVKSAFDTLVKNFKYYRLSLYNFSLSSLMEIMLSGNFKESYIEGIKEDIREMTANYRELFDKSSLYIEKMGKISLEANVLKGVGVAGSTVGNLIGKIPVVKEKSADEFLQEKGTRLKEKSTDMVKETVHNFSSLSNPGTIVFMDKMDDMIKIYNHTEKICFDDKNIYLLSKETA